MNIDEIKKEIDLLNTEIKYKKFNDLINNYFNLFRNVDIEQIKKLNIIFLNLKDKQICFSLKSNNYGIQESIVLFNTKKIPKLNDIVPILRKKIAKLIPENEEDIEFFNSARELNESFNFIDDLEIETLNELFKQIYDNNIIINDCNEYGIEGKSLEMNIEKKVKTK